MRKSLFAGLILLAACSNSVPKTPEQAILEGRAALGSAVSAFNTYASQRPFCGDTGAKPPPLCADRQVVIDGAAAAHRVASAFDQAETIVKATGTSNSSWSAIGEAVKKLVTFQSFVTAAKGG